MFNNCFVNAVAQALYACSTFRTYIQGIPNSGATTISAWKHVLLNIMTRKIHFPDQLCRSWWNGGRAKGNQEDASEFLIHTLAQLEQEIIEVNRYLRSCSNLINLKTC